MVAVALSQHDHCRWWIRAAFSHLNKDLASSFSMSHLNTDLASWPPLWVTLTETRPPVFLYEPPWHLASHPALSHLDADPTSCPPLWATLAQTCPSVFLYEPPWHRPNLVSSSISHLASNTWHPPSSISQLDADPTSCSPQWATVTQTWTPVLLCQSPWPRPGLLSSPIRLPDSQVQSSQVQMMKF